MLKLKKLILIFIISISILYGEINNSINSKSKNNKSNVDNIDEIENLLNSNLQDTENNPKKDEPKKFLGMQFDRASIPNIFISGDMVGNIGLANASEKDNIQNISEQAKNGFFIREVEFGFSGAVDHILNGVFTAAMHNENGSLFAELHELYIEFPYLPYNFFLKGGFFAPDIGRLNTIHRHDWDFTLAPLIHKNLLDKEAAYDTGAELSYLMPLPFFQEIKVGIFNGRTFGHSHNDGFAKPQPLYTARIKNFFPTSHNTGIQWGGSFFRYNPSKSTHDVDYTYGTDLTFKWIEGKQRSVTWSTEFWYKKSFRELAEAQESTLGLYSYIQYQPWQRWSFGFRFDFFGKPDTFSAKINGRYFLQDYAQSIWITFKPSEFAYFRLTAERNNNYEKKDSYILRIQAQFILGFHPAHAY